MAISAYETGRETVVALSDGAFPATMTDYGRREADRDNASRMRVLRQRRLRKKENA